MLYKSRIRGISPEQSKMAMIRMEWLERAAKNYEDPEIRKRMSIGVKARGVDVANSESGDKAAIARFQGSVLYEVESFQCPDANDLGTAVAIEALRKKHRRHRHRDRCDWRGRRLRQRSAPREGLRERAGALLRPCPRTKAT
jgi:hypothetical protein